MSAGDQERPEAGLTPADMADTIRAAALLPETTREALVAACLFVLAVETDSHPAIAAHALVTAATWPTEEEWKVEGPRLARVISNARATFKPLEIRPQMRRPQG